MTDSLWVKTTELPSYPPLREEIRSRRHRRRYGWNINRHLFG